VQRDDPGERRAHVSPPQRCAPEPPPRRACRGVAAAVARRQQPREHEQRQRCLLVPRLAAMCRGARRVVPRETRAERCPNLGQRREKLRVLAVAGGTAVRPPARERTCEGRSGVGRRGWVGWLCSHVFSARRASGWRHSRAAQMPPWSSPRCSTASLKSATTAPSTWRRAPFSPPLDPAPNFLVFHLLRIPLFLILCTQGVSAPNPACLSRCGRRAHQVGRLERGQVRVEVRGREKRHGARTVVANGGERESLEREVNVRGAQQRARPRVVRQRRRRGDGRELPRRRARRGRVTATFRRAVA